MEDIVPELVKNITEEFKKAYSQSRKIRQLLDMVKEGTATYRDAQEYSLEVSRLIGEVYSKFLSSEVLPDGRMYYNIASRLIPSALDENYTLVAGYAAKVQQALNQYAGIGIKAQFPVKNKDRIDGLVNLAANADLYDEISAQLLTAFENYSQNIVDESVKTNAEFQYRAGLRPKIIRRAERKCCEWCSRLAGEYDYPDVPDEVYQRHERCRCTVEYDPADGKRKRQNVHTREWTDAADYDKLEERKRVGIHSLLSDIAKHPGRLASFTPAQLLAELEKAGLEIKPLMKGSLKGIPFENGGGFKVIFEDGGLFQYHPAEKSHHGGAYYKISTGKGGTKRYELDGTEKRDEKTKK